METEKDKKIRIIKARFRVADRLQIFDAGNLPIKWRDKIVVEADRGVRLATAVGEVEEVDASEFSEPLPKVVRVATQKDLDIQRKREIEERKAFPIAIKKIRKHKLNMKLVDVEFYLDRSKAIFYFVAETRVDFRALVRDLARTFKTRIEMRQIGVRDEVKIMGAAGPCGLQTCCSTFLDKFESISVRMLRDQNIMLNPVRYSGICGRLMCCLAYEQPIYLELKKDFPPLGARVKVKNAEGEVVFQDLWKRMVKVKLDDGHELKVSVSEVDWDKTVTEDYSEEYEDVQGEILEKGEEVKGE